MLLGSLLLLGGFLSGTVRPTPLDANSPESQFIPTENTCDTRNTTNGECCVFPFTYRGKPYHDCTDQDHGSDWCSLTSDYDTDQMWGVCEYIRRKLEKGVFPSIVNDTKKNIFDTILEATGESGKSRDGTVYLFQGDIIMTREIRENLKNRGILVPGDDPSSLFPKTSGSRPKRAVMKTNGLRWMDSTGTRPEIPYEITRSNLHVQSVIKRAMNHWMANVRCLRFVPRQSHHRRYLSFFSGGGCYSMVGRQPGSGAQRISIGNGCGQLGVVAHEIGHALGFWHEQSRPDRDTYVTINWRNILRGMAYNFHKYGTDRINSRGVSYDYDSIMHYSSTAFANRAGARTIVGKDGRTNLGQRYGLSKKDILQANLLYCGSSPPVTNPPPRPPTPPPPSRCSFSDRHSYCPFWKFKGFCQSKNQEYKKYMDTYCQKSCRCQPDNRCLNLEDESKCLQWAKSGYCERHYEHYMKVYCKKRCGKCH